jgi:hypothetical protein
MMWECCISRGMRGPACGQALTRAGLQGFVAKRRGFVVGLVALRGQGSSMRSSTDSGWPAWFLCVTQVLMCCEKVGSLGVRVCRDDDVSA